MHLAGGDKSLVVVESFSKVVVTVAETPRDTAGDETS
jgi:hypothetical protein